ncbi:MAG TPA: halocarboxylic acid dehydrogenase DehI family protein [Planctomycetota bacterium]|nr:halocarboxylic acid dehydrogenase DehI family protein [Planctomycetota bacterium]
MRRIHFPHLTQHLTQPIHFRRHPEVPEAEAGPEVERVYHEARQKLRVTGVPLLFRTWAGFPTFFPRMWDAIRPNIETRAFESAADQLRASAVETAAGLGRIGASVPLGESQAYRLRGILDLYHYLNPKLLLVAAAVRLALDGALMGPVVEDIASIELIERGPSPTMHALEMAPEKPDDPRLRAVFADIQRTLETGAVNSNYRSLALFPDYLVAVWARLKPILETESYRRAARVLGLEARSLARSLPHPVPLSLQRLEDLGEDVKGLVRATDDFERVLATLVLNMTLVLLDWNGPEALAASPFPARTRPFTTFYAEAAS